MTAPGEVGDPRINLPIKTEPWEPKMNASVPMANAPEVGDTVALVPTDEMTMELGAAPMRVPEVGETVVILPWENPGGGIHYIGIPTANRQPLVWEAAPFPLRQPKVCDRITDTSIVVATYIPAQILRSDDSGETWFDAGVLVDEETGAQIRYVSDVCGLHEMDGRYLVVGSTLLGTPEQYRVWMYNPENGKYTPMASSAVTKDNVHQFVRTASGYFIHTDGINVGSAHRGYFSTDGDNWQAMGPYSGHLPGRSRATCLGGDTIVYGAGLNGTINRSTDHGASWNTVLSGVTPSRFVAWATGVCVMTGYSPGGYCWMQSRNGGATWAEGAATDPIGYGRGRMLVPARSSYVAMVPGRTGGTTGTYDSVVYESFNRGATWTASGSVAPYTDICEGVLLPSGIIVFPLWDDATSQFLAYRGIPP